MRKVARRTGAGLGIAGLVMVLAVALAGIHAGTPRGTTRIVGATEVVHRVDLNAADVAELAMLPGVGPRLAQRIDRERRLAGRFRTLEDCAARVSGIGPARVRWWRGLALCGGVSEER
ncbi:MAG: ComEA family DNA-binding protein [Planctomycetota bacterium]